MKQKITILLVGFLLTLGISSCIKDSAPELGDRGNTIIKFNDGPTKALFYSPFTNVKVVTLFTFRRDANSAADLQKPVEITLAEDATLIPAGYVDLPAAMYTLVADPSITVAAGKVILRFAAGEFSKSLKINLNGAAWTALSIKYGKYYKVFDAGTKQVAAGQATMAITMSIKNAWDGVYEATGTFSDVANPAWSHVNVGLAPYAETQTYELRTISATQCEVYDASVFGGFYVPFYTGTGLSGYGSFSPVLTFNGATNTITSVHNRYGTAPLYVSGNGRSAALDPTGSNDYNPSTKTIRIKYFMIQPSVVPVGARTFINESWKFIRERQ
ncbi:MAG: hypothetical protein NT021_04790 [Sphingobacteriales bacterium]|nr:hypothetical protein [Sphingobacteriales bacterium]